MTAPALSSAHSGWPGTRRRL